MDSSPEDGATFAPSTYKTSRLPVPVMPKEIAEAIVQVIGEVGTLGTDSKNTYGGYKYASVDAFYEDVGPLTAKKGLVIYASALNHHYDKIVDKDNDIRVAVTIEYAFTLFHSSGVSWSDPNDTRQVRMWWTGAQTFGAAESYAIKQFMRGLFKIPTGDRDADEDDKNARAVEKSAPAVNADRKGKGKTLTSKIVALDYGRGLEPLALDDIRDRVAAYLDGLPAEARQAWGNRNTEGLRALHGFDKPLWHAIKAAIEEGKPL
jgi:hypothetical protein